MSLEAMVKQLRTSIKSLKQAEKVQEKMVGELISKLPEDKRKAASKLMANARKGKMDINEIMSFAEGVRGLDKEEFDKSVKEAVDRVEKKKKNIDFSKAKKKTKKSSKKKPVTKK